MKERSELSEKMTKKVEDIEKYSETIKEMKRMVEEMR